MAEILLGVTGGAAAFKSVVLASMFKKAGHRVNTVMTAAACEFISPLQFTTVTGSGCYTDLFSKGSPGFIPHISLTDNADLMVIAPATAHFIARAALGLGDDLLASAFLACDSPVVVAPAMNTRMWSNAAVAGNVKLLVERGIVMAGPVDGILACGTTGKGRMMEPADIFDICSAVLAGGENR